MMILYYAKLLGNHLLLLYCSIIIERKYKYSDKCCKFTSYINKENRNFNKCSIKQLLSQSLPLRNSHICIPTVSTLTYTGITDNLYTLVAVVIFYANRKYLLDTRCPFIIGVFRSKFKIDDRIIISATM